MMDGRCRLGRAPSAICRAPSSRREGAGDRAHDGLLTDEGGVSGVSRSGPIATGVDDDHERNGRLLVLHEGAVWRTA